jgi:protocatechuate 3,4-dioxygenase beta subunit
MAYGIAAVPVLSAACGGSNTGDDTSTGDDGGDDGTSTVDARPTADAGGASDTWASGGTAAMTDKASYPDPFTTAATSCVIVASTTQGPCTTESNLVREDVSEGWTGLPVRLALKVVDSDCNPLSGASVKIWHTNLEGIYSGETPNPGMCNDNNASYIAMDFMRGVQTTAADGTAFFDTCFPGWYSGRAIHIHFQVSNGATTYRISQLFFPEDLTAEIFADHAEYQSYGQPNTTFSNDNIMSAIPSSQRAALILDYARMTDGAMLASKIVTVTG